ncbi:F-box protein CPR1-like [Cornus florida]|uniref:F-box protein CPR1-like n=1 Tax=Cornus florida TaxID=4283 RepID=UPI002898211F|nr:F-box protein CPR1-like [Cornus florida]
MGRKRKQRKPAIEGDTSNLPCEVIYNILSKLPVKSLVRFRCVCKSWRGVISDPKFAKSHLNESIRLDRKKLLDSAHYHIDLYSIANESCEGEQVSFPCRKYWIARMMCSCNGLVLLHVEKDNMYVLWNPSIRAHKKFSSPPHIYNSYVPRGLCYDSSMDDYKVIFISTDEELFVVFSFRGQCWSEPRQFPYLCFCGDMFIANGVSHWVALTPTVANVRRYPSSDNCSSVSSSGSSDNIDSGDDNGNYYSALVGQLYLHNSDTHIPQYEHDSARTCLIVYFDTADDKFKEMPPPKYIKEGDVFSLTVMKGCLSLYCNTLDKKHIVVWTMKQYGEKNSWTKFVVIPRWLGTGYLCCMAPLAPLYATKNGEIVMITDGCVINGRSIVTYNPKIKECRRIGKTKSYSPRVLLYVDSLVLPIRTPQVKRKRKKEL